jgi:hypothetical protein
MFFDALYICNIHVFFFSTTKKLHLLTKLKSLAYRAVSVLLLLALLVALADHFSIVNICSGVVINIVVSIAGVFVLRVAVDHHVIRV